MTTSNNLTYGCCCVLGSLKLEIYFVLVFLFQVWLSFAQFETSSTVEESIEQARLVKIIRLSSFHLSIEIKTQGSRLMDYLLRKNESLVC